MFAALVSANYAEYGIDLERATDYTALDATYAAAYLLALAPQTRTTSTIIARNDAAVPLRRMAADLAKSIAGNPSVTSGQMNDLGLSMHKTPAPRPAPGTQDRTSRPCCTTTGRWS